MSILRSFFRAGKEVLTPEGTIANQAITSGIWVTGINVSDRVLQLGKLVILARLLSPSDFGLMGIAFLTLAVLRQFSKLGFDFALIQKPQEDVDLYLNTAWSLKAARGVLLGIFAFMFAPFVATLFGEPRSEPVIQAIALVPVIEGLKNPGVMYFKKNLEFHRQFVFVLTGTIVSVSVAIGAAFILGNVWALVYGSIAGAVTTLLVSFLIHEFRPRFEFDRAMAAELFDYGKWIFGSGIVIFLINQGDDGFIGWFLGASALGFYQLAYRFSNAPATEITKAVSSVIFPTYSKLQDDTARLREGYFRSVLTISTLSFPIALGIIAVTPSFVKAFLGNQWEPMIPAMQVLAAWGLLRSLGATTGPLFQAIGRPDYATKIQFGKLIIIAVLIYPATALYGITGTALVIVGNALVFSEPFASYLAVRQVKGSYYEFLRMLLFPGIASGVMVIGIYVFNLSMPTTPPLLRFVLFVVVGAVVYVVVLTSLEIKFDYGLESTFRTILRSLKVESQ